MRGHPAGTGQPREEAGGRSHRALQTPEGPWKEDGDKVCSVVASGRTRGDGCEGSRGRENSKGFG